MLYDAAVVETCLKLYGQDLPEFEAVSVEATPSVGPSCLALR